MSTKLETLKQNVIENMTAEIKHASSYCWKYQYVKPSQKLYTKWAHYRLELMQYRKWLAGMSCDEFRQYLHQDVNELQAVVFGHN